MTIDLQERMRDALKMTRELETAPDWAHGLKLGEECGEVQTAILKSNGFVKHKELEESVIFEVADVINVCMALLTSHYPDSSVESIVVRLDQAMKQKNKKYYDILTKEEKDE